MVVRVKGLTPKGKLAAKLVRAEEKPETLALSRDEVTLLLEALMGFELHNRLDALADLGLQVSICYGDSDGLGRIYSVDVLTPDLRSFAKPFGAESLEEAVRIAEVEGPALVSGGGVEVTRPVWIRVLCTDDHSGHGGVVSIVAPGSD